MASTTDKSYVGGNSGNNDLHATDNDKGTVFNAGAGNDIVRGGMGDDIITGGSGNDQLYGGAGADQFRFFGSDIASSSGTDRIYDLKFGEGDTLVFGGFASGYFASDTGVNAFTSGSAAQISSWEGLANVIHENNWTLTEKGDTNVALVSYKIGDYTQTLYITNGYDAIHDLLVA